MIYTAASPSREGLAVIDAPILERIAQDAISVLPPDPVLCLGLVCQHRGMCARYLALDGVINAAAPIASCMVEERVYPMFIHTPEPCPRPPPQ